MSACHVFSSNTSRLFNACTDEMNFKIAAKRRNARRKESSPRASRARPRTLMKRMKRTRKKCLKTHSWWVMQNMWFMYNIETWIPTFFLEVKKGHFVIDGTFLSSNSLRVSQIVAYLHNIFSQINISSFLKTKGVDCFYSFLCENPHFLTLILLVISDN